MTREEFENKVNEAVADYISAAESYGDNAQLLINPVTFEVAVEDDEQPDLDSIDIMELVEMSPENPGDWIADKEAISLLADEYFK